MQNKQQYALPQENMLNLEIVGHGSVRLICSNDALHELIVGFLFNEGLISDLQQLKRLEISETSAVAWIDVDKVSLKTIRTSGLGSPILEGGVWRNSVLNDNYQEICWGIKNIFSQDYIYSCIPLMQKLAIEYGKTGGIHCSALFDNEKLLAAYEDIGRHNTLDKIAGKCLMNHISSEDTLLITSGRISSEMVRKAFRMGVSVIASYSTPTQSAYDMAIDAGMTLIGYLKKDSMRLFCGEERIV